MTESAAAGLSRSRRERCLGCLVPIAGRPPLTTTQLFDSIAIRIDGKRAWAHTASINWTFTDTLDQYRMELSNGVLIHYPTTREQPADLTVRLTKPATSGHCRRSRNGWRRHRRRSPSAAVDHGVHGCSQPGFPDRHPVSARSSVKIGAGPRRKSYRRMIRLCVPKSSSRP
jgi:hypothetical protein